MPTDPATIDQILANIRTAIGGARTWHAVRAIGIVHRDDWDTGTVKSEPTDGITFTITINGGATETRETETGALPAGIIQRTAELQGGLQQFLTATAGTAPAVVIVTALTYEIGRVIGTQAAYQNAWELERTLDYVRELLARQVDAYRSGRLKD